MARGKLIKENELEFIRVGRAYGVKVAVIARSLNRTEAGIWQQIKKMREANDLKPTTFEEVAKGMVEHLLKTGAKND